MLDPVLRDAARRNWKEPTEAERIVWKALRGDALGVRFRRQHPILSYVADFACIEAMLVVEIDGGQHGGERDAGRDAAMQRAGWRVLRFRNNEVLENLDGVVSAIVTVLKASGADLRTPTPALPRRRGRE